MAEVRINKSSCHTIWKEKLNIRVVTKFVPWLLTSGTNKSMFKSTEIFQIDKMRMSVSWGPLKQVMRHSYKVMTKTQSAQWMGSFTETKKKTIPQSCKCEDCLFWLGYAIHCEYITYGQTINKQFYLNLLWCLRVNKTCRYCHHPMLSLLLLQQFLVKQSTIIVHHSPYSPADFTNTKFLGICFQG